jgi:molybdate transport system regulatory protein
MGDMPYRLRTKIWIADQNEEVIFGLGRVKILEAIERHGSINAAAKALKMSYRAVWGRIKATEERLGKELVIRTTGGAAGGGSALTPFAKELIVTFKSFHREVLDHADASFTHKLLNRLQDEDG